MIIEITKLQILIIYNIGFIMTFHIISRMFKETATLMS